MKVRATLLSVALVALVATAQRVKTTTDNLTLNSDVELARIDLTVEPDTSFSVVQPDGIPVLKQSDITLRGYSKRVGDNKESVFVTNNTPYNISAVHLLLRYRTLDGTLITERDVTLHCDITPSSASRCDFRSFDTHHEYYYTGSGKSRKSAVPYTVSYHVSGYDITVGSRHSR